MEGGKDRFRFFPSVDRFSKGENLGRAEGKRGEEDSIRRKLGGGRPHGV